MALKLTSLIRRGLVSIVVKPITKRAHKIVSVFLIASLLTYSIGPLSALADTSAIPDDVGFQVDAPGVIAMSVENVTLHSSGVKADLILENKIDLWVRITITPGISGQSIYTTDPIATAFINAGLMPPRGKIVLKADFTDTSQLVHIEESQNQFSTLLNLISPVLIFFGQAKNAPQIFVSIANNAQFIYSTLLGYYDWHDFIDFVNDPISWETPDRLHSTAGHIVDFLSTDAGKDSIRKVLGDAGISGFDVVASVFAIFTLMKQIATSMVYSYMIIRYGNGSYSFRPIQSGVVPRPPLPPILLSPVNVSTDENPPTFQWRNFIATDSYHFELSTSSSFDTLLYSIDTIQTSLRPELSLNANTVYFWRVAGRNSAGLGAHSNPASFVINRIEYPLPPLLTPDSATFLSDVTYPDGSVVSPGQALVKTWRMQNTGGTTWGSGYQLVFVSGEQMGAPSAVNVPTTAPGSTADISVNLTAPTSGGDHTGYWRLRNPQGTYFGPEIWVSIRVPDGPPPTPPPAGQTDDFEIVGVSYPSVVTPGQTFRPTVTMRVNWGQLLQSRGDMLRNTDGNLYGAWPHVAVVGTVNAGQTYDFTFYTDNPITAPTTEGTYETRWRIWRDGNWAGPEIVIRFDVRQPQSNHRPNRPSSLSPGDWWVQWDGGQVTLCAQHNGDLDGDSIVGYEFNVQGANTWNSSEVGSSCATTSGLGFYTYSWEVRVKDSRGEWSDWSEPDWRFTIHNPAAIQGPDFSPASPSAADTVKVWACSNGGTMKYFVNLANDGTGNGQWWQFNEGPICPDPGHSDPNLWPGWQTRNYTDGPHRVRVENGLGGVVEGVYTLLPRRPAPPDLLNPPHLSFQNNRTILFTWGHGMFGGYSTRATSYTLRVSTNPDPDQNPILNVTVDAGTTSYVHTFGQDYSALYWRVIATNAQGSSNSDATFQFGIDRQNPSAQVNSLPETSVDSAITVGWGGTDNLAGIRWYDVQYKDGDRGAWVDWQTNISHTAAIFIGQAGHKYYFRARALDKAGNQELYPADDSWDTFTTINPAAAPPTPWWDSNYANKRNIPVLNNDNDTMVTGYPVHLHFDSGTTPTAAELYAASQTDIKGDDFRIIYNNTTQLSRWVQNFSSSRIDIWFKTQANIPGNSSSATEYQLYYGSPTASNPPGDIDNVMPPGRDANTMGLWHFAEGSGSTFIDTSGRGHYGTLFNAYTWGEDAFGPYIQWNGGGDGAAWGEVGTSSDFDLNALTMEAWVYPMSGGTPEMTIFYRPLASPDNCPGYKLAVSDTKIDLQLNCAAGRDIDGQLSLDTWYHIAATFDGSNMRIYRNGSLIRTVSYGESVRSTSGRSLYLGGTPWSQTFRGRVRHARLSNIARSDFSYAANIAAITIAPSLAAGDVILPPVLGAPDLAVLNLVTYPNPGGGTLAQAVVQNQGNRNTQNGFYTDLYLDHLPTGTSDYTGSIRFWVNDPITAGATITLTTVFTELAGLGALGAQSIDAISESRGTLYAQVDSSGVVSETDDLDNIYSPGTAICVATPDAYEADDSFGAARLISLGQSQTHNFSGPGDRDWIKFSAQAGVTYALRTLNLGPTADTYLYLYSTGGTTLLASNDDYAGSLASQIEWTAPVTGTYYVLIQHWNPNVGGCGTGYTFTLSKPGSKVFLPLVMRN